jgi:hypothetical protein
MLEGGEGRRGCRIVILMPEAINFVDGRRQKRENSLKILELHFMNFFKSRFEKSELI